MSAVAVTIEELNTLVEKAYEAAFAYEQELIAVYMSAYERQTNLAASRFAAETMTAAWTPPVYQSLSEGMNEKEQKQADRVRDEAATAVAAVLAAAGVAVSSQEFLDAISDRAQLNFEQEIMRQLAKVVGGAFDAHLSVEETVNLIRTKIPEIIPSSAEMLAQTELTAIVNERAVAAANAQFRGVASKTWRTVGDNRVRIAHAHAEGQTVPLEQPFQVGGSSLMYPGDPMGPLRLVARCRCRLSFSEGAVAASAVDPWYEQPDPWYQDQLTASASVIEEALARNPRRVIIEYGDDQPQELNGAGWPELDREVSYQVKFFDWHGFWSDKQLSGGPPIMDMPRVMQLAVLIATNPELPIAKATRDRLERKGLLY